MDMGQSATRPEQHSANESRRGSSSVLDSHLMGVTKGVKLEALFAFCKVSHLGAFDVMTSGQSFHITILNLRVRVTSPWVSLLAINVGSRAYSTSWAALNQWNRNGPERLLVQMSDQSARNGAMQRSRVAGVNTILFRDQKRSAVRSLDEETPPHCWPDNSACLATRCPLLHAPREKQVKVTTTSERILTCVGFSVIRIRVREGQPRHDRPRRQVVTRKSRTNQLFGETESASAS